LHPRAKKNNQADRAGDLQENFSVPPYLSALRAAFLGLWNNDNKRKRIKTKRDTHNGKYEKKHKPYCAAPGLVLLLKEIHGRTRAQYSRAPTRETFARPL
jgi:hypothetical protein